MPKYDMREKIRRMSIIVYLLQRKDYHIYEIQEKCSRIMDHQWSKSIIDKDLAMLRDEFDCPIGRNGHKLGIHEEYSFINQLNKWVQFYE